MVLLPFQRELNIIFLLFRLELLNSGNELFRKGIIRYIDFEPR